MYRGVGVYLLFIYLLNVTPATPNRAKIILHIADNLQCYKRKIRPLNYPQTERKLFYTERTIYSATSLKLCHSGNPKQSVNYSTQSGQFIAQQA